MEIGTDGNAVNNIGDMEKRSFLTISGSSAESGAQKSEKTSFRQIVTQPMPKVKQEFSVKDDAADVKNNTHDPNNHIYMGTTSVKLANILGLPKLPMLVTSNHIYSVAVSESQAKRENRFRKNTNYHKKRSLSDKHRTGLRLSNTMLSVDFDKSLSQFCGIVKKKFQGTKYLSQSFDKAFNESGVVATALYDYSEDSAAYSHALDEARKADEKNGWCVTPQTSKELKGKALRMDANGGIGYRQVYKHDQEGRHGNCGARCEGQGSF